MNEHRGQKLGQCTNDHFHIMYDDMRTVYRTEDPNL